MTNLDGYARYAVFWAPPEGSGLARYGAAWLGWDCAAGVDVAQPALPLPRPVAEMTRTPRRYGFHATLKPPFRLAGDAAALDRAIAALAARLPATTLTGLAPSARLGFAALMLASPEPGVEALAAACIRDLDGFRVQPIEAELARRRATGQTPRQDQNLTRWGYPYIFQDFRFHLTLTGRLQPGEAGPVVAAIAPLVAPHLDPSPVLDQICLVGDPGTDGGFRILRRYPLTG